MQLKRWTPLLALTCAVACAEAPEEGGQPAARTIRVEVGSGPRIDLESRTELGELEGDRQTVRWSTDDRIALWALDAEGNAALDAEPFALWHYNATFDNARFTAEIPEMAAGTYTYYAVSPVPASWEGTRAAYEIPAVQSGRFDGACDIMVAADPVTAPALTEGDNSARVSFEFLHKVHLLKLRIPENKLGERITRLEITFPEPVVGTLSVDAADPSAAPELTQGGSTLTIEFPEPVEADADTYFYAAIAPIQLGDTDAIRVKAYGELCESKTGVFTGKALPLRAGRITPIALTVPEAGVRYTAVDFTLTDTGEATLGERVRSMTFTAPDGATFDNGERIRTFDIDQPGRYRMLFRDYPAELSQQSVEVSFDSEHAVVTRRISLPALEQGAANTVEGLSIPYLLEEDFESLTSSFTDKYDNPGVGGTAIVDGDGDGHDLSQWGLATQGWTAARVGVQNGGATNGAVRICARVENQQIKKNTYNARIDSAPFSHLKEGAAVRLKVAYNYKGGRWSIVRKNIFGGDGGPGNGSAIYCYGYTTAEGWQKGSTSIQNPLCDWTVIPGTEGSDRNEKQTYDDIDLENAFIIPSADRSCRASWMVSSTMNNAPVAGANGNFWLYLDNIRVSIANE